MSSGIVSLPFRHDPADSLFHIIENADRVARYLGGMDCAAFEQNERVRDAVERCVERICEAAVSLGAQAEILMPDQPWRDIGGMGNRLRHAYDRVNGSILWNTAQVRVPELAAAARIAMAKIQKS